MSRQAILRWSLFLLLAVGVAEAQVMRVRALGGMTLALRDPDFVLNAYDWGGNPAWLAEDDTASWLKIVPAATEEWGDLRRRYDPARSVHYGAAFDGRKNLFEKGTFRGVASYDVESKRDVYRSLKRYPYTGEAFFVTDTTIGNFTYSGPTIQFAYSYELFPSFALGASVRYRIQDGLKDTYSRTKVLYRELRARFGATLELGEEWVAGVTCEPWDTQESMEAKSEESFEVELFNFRGETYATRQRSTAIDHKIRSNGVDVSGHLIGHPLPGLEVGLLGGYGSGQVKVLVSKGLEKEVEEGFSPSREWEARAQARYAATDDLTFGASVRFRKVNNWSEHSALELLLWEWTMKETAAGIGAAWRLHPDVLAGAEVEFAASSMDSSKYIDNRYTAASPTRVLTRVGVEVGVSAALTLRGGGLYRSPGFDFESGFADVAGFGVTAGAGVRITDTVSLDLFVELLNNAPQGTSDIQRGGAAGGLSLVLRAP
jgi:hypothetical protein